MNRHSLFFAALLIIFLGQTPLVVRADPPYQRVDKNEATKDFPPPPLPAAAHLAGGIFNGNATPSFCYVTGQQPNQDLMCSKTFSPTRVLRNRMQDAQMYSFPPNPPWVDRLQVYTSGDEGETTALIIEATESGFPILETCQRMILFVINNPAYQLKVSADYQMAKAVDWADLRAKFWGVRLKEVDNPVDFMCELVKAKSN